MAGHYSSGLFIGCHYWFFLSAKLGNGLVKTAIIRNVIVGIITMIIHYGVGLML